MLYVGPQSTTPGVDQINIPIPSNTPKGLVDILCTFYIEIGNVMYDLYPSANTVTIMVQ